MAVSGEVARCGPVRVTYGGTLAVILASFTAHGGADRVTVAWETVSEMGNAGFNLYRGTSPAGWDRRLNAYLIPSQSPGNPGGFIYTWQDDADLQPGQVYWYWLKDVNVSGTATVHGPTSAQFAAPTAVTLAGLEAGSGLPPAMPWIVAAGLAALAVAGVVAGRRHQPAS